MHHSVLLAALVVRSFAIDDRLAIALYHRGSSRLSPGVTNRKWRSYNLAIPHVSTLFAPLVVTAGMERREYWAAASGCSSTGSVAYN